MASAIEDPAARAAFALVNEGLDALAEAGVELADPADACAWIDCYEAIGRRVRAGQVELVGRIQAKGLHRADGHRSAKVMARHRGRLSNGEALARERNAKALAVLPAVRLAYALGNVGSQQVDRIGRLHANPRVRDALPEQDQNLATLAARLSYAEFDRRVSDWERLTDEDGADDIAGRTHANRDFSMHQDYDGSWSVTGGWGSLRGVEIQTIFDRYLKAEWDADWAKARLEHGATATADRLCRTDAQRRADAFYAMVQAAGSVEAGRDGGSRIVTNIVMDATTFERWCRRASGERVEPIAVDLDLQPVGGGVGFRCSTLDGHRVHPGEAFTAAVLGHVSRVIVGADSVVIDKGRTQRLFTGHAGTAVRITNPTCSHPGCQTPATHCQIDHMVEWGDRSSGDDEGGGDGDGDADDGRDPPDGLPDGDPPGGRPGGGGGCGPAGSAEGRTDVANGDPRCGFHNRFKHDQRLEVERDQDGNIHTYRPDGTEIE
jgi:hypothetical protein